MDVLHESDIKMKSLPGRALGWVASQDVLGSRYCSSCLIRVQPGNTVKPAHSHPKGEEIIHILAGEGQVNIDGKVSSVRSGSTVLFREGAIHMLRNTGTEELKVICFFAPHTAIEDYRFHEDFEWK